LLSVAPIITQLLAKPSLVVLRILCKLDNFQREIRDPFMIRIDHRHAGKHHISRTMTPDAVLHSPFYLGNEDWSFLRLNVIS